VSRKVKLNRRPIHRAKPKRLSKAEISQEMAVVMAPVEARVNESLFEAARQDELIHGRIRPR